MSHSNRVRHDSHYKQNESDSSHKHHTSQDRSEYCKPQHSFFRNHVSSAYEPLTQFNKGEIIGPEGPERSAVQGHEYGAKKDTEVVTDVEQIVKLTEQKENQLMSRLHETLNCYHNLPTIYGPPRRTSAEKHLSTFKEESGERPSPRSLRSGYVKNSTHHTGLRTPTNKVLSNAHPNRPLDNEPSLCKTFAFTVFSNIPSRSQGTAFGTSAHEQHQICTTHVLFSSDPDRSPLVCDREGESQSDVRSLQMYRHRCMLQKECLHTPIPCEEWNTDELSDAADFSQSKWQRTQHSSSAYDNSLFDLYLSAERDVYQKRDRGTPIIISALISFYKIHNPQRIPFVYDIIRQYRSCTTELLTKLERKYKARCFFSCFYRLMRYPLSMEHIHREMVRNQENYETFGLHLRGIDAGGCEQGIFNLYDAESHDSSFSSSTLLNDLLELKEAAGQVSSFLGDMEKRLSSSL